MKSLVGKWGISHNEETYSGEYESREAAIAACDPGSGASWIGQYQDPPPPASYIEASDIIEHIQCQDDYSIECAEGALHATKSELEDLTESLRATFNAWMKRNSIDIGFYLIDSDTIEKIATPTK